MLYRLDSYPIAFKSAVLKPAFRALKQFNHVNMKLMF